MLFTPLLALLAPHDCLGCGIEGRLLCRSCQSEVVPANEQCYKCLLSTYDSRTCLECGKESSVSAVYAVARYEGLAKDILWRLKFGRARAAATEIGHMIAYRLGRKSTGRYIVTYIPTANNRVRQRGYDQAELIAWAAARKLSLPCYRLLARQHNRKQVGASRDIRTSQLADAFRPVHLRYIEGATILLIDDVVTTGATLEAAAASLIAAGAKRVDAAIFAQA